MSVSLGIDVGTTSVKVLALDDEGAIRGVASNHHADELDGGAQIDAREWERSLHAALAELAQKVDFGSVAAVGFSGNMSSVVLVDGAGEPLAPASLLADQRGADEIADLDETISAEILAKTGNRPHTVFSVATLLWWQARNPQVLASAEVWLAAKDYLRFKLIGTMATEPTDAYNSLLLRSDGWDVDLIERLGLPPRIFPQVGRPDLLAGTLTEAAAERTGLPVGTPVAYGAGDVAAALEGGGGLRSDELAISLGTSATIMAGLPEPRLPDAVIDALTLHPSADGGWFALGSLLTGGLALNWIRDMFREVPLPQLPDAGQGGEQLVFLPYLAGIGSPNYVPTARGAIVGIQPGTRPEEVTGALLEAVAFDFAGLGERLGRPGYSRVIVSGGGSRIPTWPQVLADVLRAPVITTDEPDLSAVGAALLGWRAIGRSVQAQSATRCVEPRPGLAQLWAARRCRYETVRNSYLDLIALD